jgi:hypothetical protein
MQGKIHHVPRLSGLRLPLLQRPPSSFKYSTFAAPAPLITVPTPRRRNCFDTQRRTFTFTARANANTPRPWPYLHKPYDKMPHLDKYFSQVDGMKDGFIERLREAVAIPSISSEDEKRPDVIKVG